MKSLVVFYSRTGTTKKVAEAISKKLRSETEEIRAKKDRKGVYGYLFSGKEATMKMPAEILKTRKDPSRYDLVIVGTPVWSWSVSSPVRAYLMQNAAKLKKVKTIGFFCTQGGSGADAAFRQMEGLLGKRPAAILDFRTLQVRKEDIYRGIKGFVSRISKNI